MWCRPQREGADGVQRSVVVTSLTSFVEKGKDARSKNLLGCPRVCTFHKTNTAPLTAPSKKFLGLTH